MSSAQPAAPSTKQQRVYETLRERILTGANGPGFRLVIDAVAAELEVSTLPVREAIRRLEAEGLVIYRPNIGAQVAPAKPELFEDEVTVLALLEGYATAGAVPHLTDTDIAHLHETTDRMVSAMERMDPLAFGRHNQEFHAVFAERCPNRALVEILREVERRIDATRRTVFTYIPHRGPESVAEHRELIGLVEAGERSDRIECAARAHTLRTLESFRAWQREHGTGSAPTR